MQTSDCGTFSLVVIVCCFLQSYCCQWRRLSLHQHLNATVTIFLAIVWNWLFLIFVALKSSSNLKVFLKVYFGDLLRPSSILSSLLNVFTKRKTDLGVFSFVLTGFRSQVLVNRGQDNLYEQCTSIYFFSSWKTQSIHGSKM